MRALPWILLAAFIAGCALQGGLDSEAHIAAAVADPERPPADLRRDAWRHPVDILRFAGVRPGERVYEFAAGGGYYTDILARAVGASGRVFAEGVDLDAWRERPAGRLPQVSLVGADVEPEAIDLVFTALNYHDLVNLGVDRGPLLARFRRMLRPGGRLLIIDHSAAPGSSAEQAAALHRVPEAEVRAEVEASGFRFARESDVLRNPADLRSRSVFDPDIRGRTDRFVLLFEKPRESQ